MKYTKSFQDFQSQRLNEALTLFGDMDDYIARFKTLPDFVIGEIQPRVAGTPDEFPDLDSKGNWRTDGWNYTAIRAYTAREFPKGAKEVLKFVTDQVIGPDKKGWTGTNMRKPNSVFGFNKKDMTIGFEKPGLGFIFFYCWDNSTDWSRGRRTTALENPTYQVQGYFMNAQQSWGDIDKFPKVKTVLDDIFTYDKREEEIAKATVSYLKNRFNL